MQQSHPTSSENGEISPSTELGVNRPLLFQASSTQKSSREILDILGQNLLVGTASLSRQLKTDRLEVKYGQTAHDEYDCCVRLASLDFCDGARLAKLVDTLRSELRSENVQHTPLFPTLTLPATSQAQKKRNIQIVLDSLQKDESRPYSSEFETTLVDELQSLFEATTPSEQTITRGPADRMDLSWVQTDEIVVGHRQKTLALCIRIMFYFDREISWFAHAEDTTDGSAPIMPKNNKEAASLVASWVRNHISSLLAPSPAQTPLLDILHSGQLVCQLIHIHLPELIPLYKMNSIWLQEGSSAFNSLDSLSYSEKLKIRQIEGRITKVGWWEMARNSLRRMGGVGDVVDECALLWAHHDPSANTPFRLPPALLSSSILYTFNRLSSLSRTVCQTHHAAVVIQSAWRGWRERHAAGERREGMMGGVEKRVWLDASKVAVRVPKVSEEEEEDDECDSEHDECDSEHDERMLKDEITEQHDVGSDLEADHEQNTQRDEERITNEQIDTVVNEQDIREEEHEQIMQRDETKEDKEDIWQCEGEHGTEQQKQISFEGEDATCEGRLEDEEELTPSETNVCSDDGNNDPKMKEEENEQILDRKEMSDTKIESDAVSASHLLSQPVETCSLHPSHSNTSQSPESTPTRLPTTPSTPTQSPINSAISELLSALSQPSSPTDPTDGNIDSDDESDDSESSTSKPQHQHSHQPSILEKAQRPPCVRKIRFSESNSSEEKAFGALHSSPYPFVKIAVLADSNGEDVKEEKKNRKEGNVTFSLPTRSTPEHGFLPLHSSPYPFSKKSELSSEFQEKATKHENVVKFDVPKPAKQNSFVSLHSSPYPFAKNASIVRDGEEDQDSSGYVLEQNPSFILGTPQKPIREAELVQAQPDEHESRKEENKEKKKRVRFAMDTEEKREEIEQSKKHSSPYPFARQAEKKERLEDDLVDEELDVKNERSEWKRQKNGKTKQNKTQTSSLPLTPSSPFLLASPQQDDSQLPSQTPAHPDNTVDDTFFVLSPESEIDADGKWMLKRLKGNKEESEEWGRGGRRVTYLESPTRWLDEEEGEGKEEDGGLCDGEGLARGTWKNEKNSECGESEEIVVGQKRSLSEAFPDEHTSAKKERRLGEEDGHTQSQSGRQLKQRAIRPTDRNPPQNTKKLIDEREEEQRHELEIQVARRKKEREERKQERQRAIAAKREQSLPQLTASEAHQVDHDLKLAIPSLSPTLPSRSSLPSDSTPQHNRLSVPSSVSARVSMMIPSDSPSSTRRSVHPLSYLSHPSLALALRGTVALETLCRLSQEWQRVGIESGCFRLLLELLQTSNNSIGSWELIVHGLEVIEMIVETETRTEMSDLWRRMDLERKEREDEMADEDDIIDETEKGEKMTKTEQSSRNLFFTALHEVLRVSSTKQDVMKRVLTVLVRVLQNEKSDETGNRTMDADEKWNQRRLERTLDVIGKKANGKKNQTEIEKAIERLCRQGKALLNTNGTK
ncbi:hypothetical protein BLNAU_20884 [Blattamonas nauphoetae]|uniref:Uncharacterized protein n=1 Tax=Blattamonas nauphoetae TaxID=2049346 RepID=A0ABQ9X1N4_9EUKA|nr:hypothetical protein BLNAU_20884 [Blattamonas nauphoetae]